MKILMVNKFLYPNGGSETYIFQLGDHLVSQGHEVQYFGMEHPQRCVGNRADAYTRNMDFHGASMTEKLSYPLRTIYSAEARRKIRRVLDDFQPDVCHLNNFNFQLTPSIILEIVKWRRQTGRRCRIVYTAHDYQLVCPNHSCRNSNGNCEKCLGGNYLHCVKHRCIHGSMLRSLIGAAEAYFWRINGAYRHIDTIICCSNFLKGKLDTHPQLRDKTIAMHNFVQPLPAVKCEKKDYVLYFGRFSEEKGIRTLIEACKRLPDIPFIFAGTGPLEGELQGIENIRNVGFQTGKSLHRLIREARFSVYPSEWYENCPFSVMESIMLGTPVLGADIGGIPELIEDGKTGKLFESGNADDLTQSIYALRNNAALLDAYSANCLNRAFTSTNAYVQNLMEIYAG